MAPRLDAEAVKCLKNDCAVGWSTSDSVAAVSKWFSDALRSPALDEEKWAAQLAAAAPKPIDPTGSRFQQLLERATKGDQAAVAEFEKLNKQMEEQQRNAESAQQQSAGKVANPPSSAADSARWIVAQRKDGRISRVVLVYALPVLKRTVIQLAWDLTDYPSAWPMTSN